MLNIARVGDAISHGGSIIQGSDRCFANGRAIARLGDSVVCAIHGNQIIVSADDNVFVDGIAVARIGDSVSCGATIIEGSPNIVL
jgi:uncharacterized Zn-binding protein involved in type VI secretion